MGYAAALLSRTVRRVVLVQALLSLLAAVVLLSVQGWASAAAACYGGAVSILCACLLGWRVHRAGDLVWQGSGSGAWSLCLGMAERFGVALAAFAAGIGLLQLPAIPQVAAFALAQLAYIAAVWPASAVGASAR